MLKKCFVVTIEVCDEAFEPDTKKIYEYIGDMPGVDAIEVFEAPQLLDWEEGKTYGS